MDDEVRDIIVGKPYQVPRKREQYTIVELDLQDPWYYRAERYELLNTKRFRKNTQELRPLPYEAHVNSDFHFADKS